MDILLSEVGWEILVPIHCPVHNNLARLGQRTRRTIGTSPDGRLVRWKNGIDGLIDKGDFHITLVGPGWSFGRWRSVACLFDFNNLLVNVPQGRSGVRSRRPL